MRRHRKLLIILAAMLIMIPGSVTSAAAKDNNDKAAPEKAGHIASKDEVVYGTLSKSGGTKEIFVVNMLDVNKPGVVTDYGEYTSVKNLTDVSEIEQSGENVKVTAPEGKFYYQGNLDNTSLPWEFNITYHLDGKEISPDELAGKSGHLKIAISTSANETVKQDFFENFMLQISMSFSADKTENLKAEDGMVANAGKNLQVTFTVMPEKEEELILEADVTAFEFDGIEIAGVPSAIGIDAPDTDDMTEDIKTLADAIAEINDGVADLEYGIGQLNDGAKELKTGSQQYKNGISELNNSSDQLISGSSEIKQALETMNKSLSGIEDLDLSELGELTNGLSEIQGGLSQTADGLSALKSNYANAYKALDKAMNAIPAHKISDKELQALYQSGADKQTIDKLTETYAAAQKAKGTYDQVKQGFDAVDSTLDTVIRSLQDTAGHMDKMTAGLSDSLGNMDSAEGLQELQAGVTALSKNYKEFHNGLVDYTGGVSELASNYSQLDKGIGELSDGTGELAAGAKELHKGTAKLERSTSDMPEEMTKEIDEMINEFDKSDYDAVSFVSSKNEDVYSVQFVLKTDSIEIAEPEKVQETKEEKKGFWAKLKDLFL